MVSIHHIICEDITHKCNIGEIISIRKFGRIIILENVKTTKKDRLVIKNWRKTLGEVMKEYKDTLLMPKTDFPMRGNLGVNEIPIQKKMGRR